MNTKIIAIIGVIILAGIIIAGVGRSGGVKTPAEALETQTNSEGDVNVSAAPELGGNEWLFTIKLDTHSQELVYDVVALATLVADGKEYKPINWQGDASAGHHRESVLLFQSIEPMPRSMELKIINVGGIPERIFRWTLIN